MSRDRTSKSRILMPAFVLFTALCSAAGDADASVYANAGVRSKEISVCFVGDALKSRPRRVDQIQQFVKNYEYLANIIFNFVGTCALATTGPDGNDFYDGDIRIVIPNTSVDATVPIPGKGCPDKSTNSGWGSWSNFPNDLARNRSCLYNMKLGDDPSTKLKDDYLNHTLHEFGHALGLAHEHQRSDSDRTCVALDNWCKDPKNGGCGIRYGLLTPYDTDSVMHYQFLSCGISGNYGYDGLSAWDQLGAHILYPEDRQIAEFVGTTVIRTTDALQLDAAWEFRGANIDYVVTTFVWELNNSITSLAPQLSKVIATPGTYTLSLYYNDFLGRSYSYTGQVRVLTPADFIRRITAPMPSRLPLL